MAALSLAAVSAWLLCTAREPVAVQAAKTQDTTAGNAAFYTAQVAPILQANCLRCHGGMNHRGGLSMATREGLLKGGESGPAIVPGHPEESLLIHLVHQENLQPHQKAMPPRGKLNPGDIATLETWIRSGAAMPPIQ